MRMIALGQAWQAQGGDVHFLCAEITSALEERLASEGFQLSRISAVLGSKEDLEQTTHLITDALQADIQNARVVLDGYHFGSDYQLGIKAEGFKLLVVDDYGHADFYHADWVLNQNLSAREELYASRAPHTRLLLGTKFALLRREFLNYRGWQRQIPDVARKVLVTLGGADPDNVTGKVIEALAPLDIEVKVVVGGSNPHLPELQKAVETMKAQPAEIELVINPADMPGLMAWADLAIAAGGSTAWELAFMGLPSLFVILAENQVGIATELESAGFGVCLGRGIDLGIEAFSGRISTREQNPNIFFDFMNNKSLRQQISLDCKNLVDGGGAKRLAEIFQEKK